MYKAREKEALLFFSFFRSLILHARRECVLLLLLLDSSVSDIRHKSRVHGRSIVTGDKVTHTAGSNISRPSLSHTFHLGHLLFLCCHGMIIHTIVL